MGATAGAVSEGGEARQATGDSAHQGAHHAATLIQPVPAVVVMDGPGVGVKKESSMPEVEEFDSKEAAKGLEREEGLGEEDGCKEDEDERKDGSGDFWAEDELARLALAFFTATTKCSNDNEDILPQEDSDEMKLSVFHIFASLFPEAVGEHGSGAKNKRLRLHFNKIGYQIYNKEQSRRVPAVRAKPGNPGYGFRRARWRDTSALDEDRKHCEMVLLAAGCSQERVSAVQERVQETCNVWDSIRRPSRPAGPGRPRRSEDASAPTTPALRGICVKGRTSDDASNAQKTSGKKTPASAKINIDEERRGLGKFCSSAKGKNKASKGGLNGGGKHRKVDFREDHVPNLVKDEADESGASLSPQISFRPLETVQSMSSEGTKRSLRDASGGEMKRLKVSGSPLGADDGRAEASVASSLSPMSLAARAQGLSAQLPPLKLGEPERPILQHQCAPLPCLINTQPFSGLENLEKLASLASTSEKLVSKTRLEKSGAQQPNAFCPNKSHKSLPIGNFDVDDIPHI